jgi:hypothetical protein
MKQIYFLIVLFISLKLSAQTDGLNYQAVILNPNQQELPGVDASSNILPNKTIAIRFTIINNDNSNDYQETQITTTDAFGMINLFIGEGSQSSANTFNEIEWDGTPKNLKVDIDFEGGINFQSLSEQKLTFIPYAFHRNITATGSLTVDGNTIFNNNLNVSGITTLGDDLIVNGTTNLNDEFYVNNQSVSNLSGALNVDGQTTLNDDVTINANSTLNGTLETTGAVSFGNNLSVDGQTTLNNEVTVNGDMAVNGITNFFGDANLNSNLTVQGNSVLANLVVRGGNDVGGASGANHIALFENTNPSQGNHADGIAIRINGNSSGKLGFRNRFVSFYGNGDYLAGRIESYDLFAGDLWESFPIPNFENLFNVFDFDNVLQGGELPTLTFSGGSLPTAVLTTGTLPSAYLSRGSLPNLNIDFSFKDGLDWDFNSGSLPSLSFNDGTLPSLTFNAGTLPDVTFDIGEFPTLNFDGFFNPQVAADIGGDIGAMVGWGMRNGSPGFMPSGPWSIAMVPLVLAAKQVAMNQGVIYGSKGADYAEWLEKEDVTDKFMFGEVVGVKGGKISRITDGADQVMSISLAPIVLGNMPDKERQSDFEKVGFMGQVPVLVLGDVEIGDYIVASGYNDGYAKAIPAKDITLNDLKGIIGKAWSGSEGRKANLINVSVGLKTNEWVEILKQQEKRLNTIESKIERLESKIDNLVLK